MNLFYLSLVFERLQLLETLYLFWVKRSCTDDNNIYMFLQPWNVYWYCFWHLGTQIMFFGW